MPHSQLITKGQCQCENIKYRLHGAPLTYYVCHCRHCQLQSASAFGLSLWVKTSDFELLSGHLTFWTETADSGAGKECAFCERCGTRIYHGFDEPGDEASELNENTALLTIKAGTLDNASSLEPIAHIWTSRALSWVLPATTNIRCYPKGPDSTDELFSLWQQSHQSPAA